MFPSFFAKDTAVRMKWLRAAALACALSSGAVTASVAPETFDFALIGDLPYSDYEEAQFLRMKEQIDKTDLAFVVHDGDFKSGWSECSDELYQQRLELFNSFSHPFIFIFGDNDWLDCDRAFFARAHDPMERLTMLRKMFTQGDTSLGRRTIKLERQSEQKGYELFRENVRWSLGGVTFVGLHIIGGHNNLRAGAEAYREYSQRNQANLAWLKQSFAQARERNARAVMVIIQANPRFESKRKYRKGFNDFLDLLEQQVIDFAKPVVLVHGDTHTFQINKPLKDSRTNQTLENFTRVETFGSPTVRWIKATVDANDPQVFKFQPMEIE